MTIYNFPFNATGVNVAAEARTTAGAAAGAGGGDPSGNNIHHAPPNQKRQHFFGPGSNQDLEELQQHEPSAKRCRFNSSGSDISITSNASSSGFMSSSWPSQSSAAAGTATASSSSAKSPMKLQGPFPGYGTYIEQLD